MRDAVLFHAPLPMKKFTGHGCMNISALIRWFGLGAGRRKGFGMRGRHGVLITGYHLLLISLHVFIDFPEGRTPAYSQSICNFVARS